MEVNLVEWLPFQITVKAVHCMAVSLGVLICDCNEVTEARGRTAPPSTSASASLQDGGLSAEHVLITQWQEAHGCAQTRGLQLL
jgi:hypothetical protein